MTEEYINLMKDDIRKNNPGFEGIYLGDNGVSHIFELKKIEEKYYEM